MGVERQYFLFRNQSLVKSFYMDLDAKQKIVFFDAYALPEAWICGDNSFFGRELCLAQKP